jgi:hypothetical protein
VRSVLMRVYATLTALPAAQVAIPGSADMARGLSRGTPMGTPVGTPLPPIAEVELGLGRIVALHHRPSTSYQIR